MQHQRTGHDIIVIGASAGGIEPLRRLMRDLPSDLAASVFVVVHVGAERHLAALLSRGSALPVTRASNGERVKRGHVYVAGPGAHLLLHSRHVLLRRGPRENFARPAIDPLFRSAAATFGGRVIGVVLSGGLNDGTAGLIAIKRCGGLAVVQDPEDAASPGMPRSALQHVEADHVTDAAGLANLLVRLSQEPAGETPEIPLSIRLETAIAAQEPTDMATEDQLGKLSRFSCPECHGTLWEIEEGSFLRYRCHVGHAYTTDAVLEGQAQEIDRILEQLLRAHQERAALARRMANQELSENRHNLAAQLARRAKEYEDEAKVIGELVRNGLRPLSVSSGTSDGSNA